MPKLSQNQQIIIAAAAGGALLIGCIIAIIAAVRPDPEPVSMIVETDWTEEMTTQPPHPIKERLPVVPCRYNLGQLSCENQIYRYMDGETVTSAFGIDVSSHQGEIDWTAVKNAGVEFVFVRAGFRGYESGKLVPDETFDKNMQGAMDVGLPVGVYFYSQAITAKEAREEAELTLSMMKDYDITLPVVFDWEVITNGDYARTANITTQGLTDCVIAFCETVKNAGYTPMYYQNKETALKKMDLELVTDYGFWLAEYDDLPTYPHHYDIWQYTDRGHVDGIEGRVDLNICFTPLTPEEE